MKKLILVVIGLLIIGGLWWGKQEREKKSGTFSDNQVTMRIAYGPYVNPIFIAMEKKYFEEQGLKVEAQLVPASSTTTAGLMGGEIDSAWVPYTVLFAFEQASPGNFKIISSTVETTEKPYSYLIVKENISGLNDLRGKKILVRAGTNGRLQAETILKALGVDLTRVEIVQVEASITPAAFAKDEIAATIDVEPSATAIMQQGGAKVLARGVRAEYITNPYPTGAQVLSTQFVKEHPQEAEKFRLAFEQAIDYMNNSDKEAREIMKKYLNLDPVVMDNMAAIGTQKYEEIDREAVEKLMEIGVENMELNAKIDLSQIYYEKI